MPKSETMKICERHALVVDDHPLVARGIADFLRTHCAVERVYAFTRAEDVWNHIQVHGPPDLALVDFWLSEGTALPILDRMRQQHPGARILVICGDDDPAIYSKVRRTGVAGFLLKQAESAVFSQAVRAVLEGQTWFADESASDELTAGMRDLPLTPAELGLTPRQGDVLALMLRGLPNKRVAKVLSLTEQTVKEHVTGILARLGASNRVELIMRLRGKRIDASEK